jgi:hypothetical protein
LDLDALLDAHLPAPPEGSKGHSVDPVSVLDSLGEEGKKLLANFRDDYRRKTQELAAKSKALDADRVQLITAREEALKAKMNVPAGTDRFSDEGADLYAEAAAARVQLELLQPEKARAIQESKVQAAEQFFQAHPDVVQYESRIVQLVTQHGKNAQDAYWIAKGEALDNFHAEQAKAAAEAKRAEIAAGAAGVRTAGLGATGVPSAAKSTGRRSLADVYHDIINGGS